MKRKVSSYAIARAKRTALGRILCRLVGDEKGAVAMEYPTNIDTNIQPTYIITPYAATPSSPAMRLSCQLYNKPTRDIETFASNSEEPFVQVFNNALPSKQGTPSCKRLYVIA